MTRWCPGCGAEWWTSSGVCDDCGADLVDELPPPTEPAEVPAVAELELGDLDAAGRWNLSLVLQSHEVVHQWRGGMLVLPESAVGIVEAALGAEVDDRQLTADEAEEAVRARAELSWDLDGLGPSGDGAKPPRLRRLVAFVCDSFLVSLFVVPVLMTWTYDAGRPEAERIRPTTGSLWLTTVVVLLVPAVAVAVFGRTPGMAASGLEVVGRDGRRPGWGAAFARAVLAAGWFVPAWGAVDERWVEVAVGWVGPVLVFAPILVPSRGRGLHDLVTRTVVQVRPLQQRRGPLV